LTCLRKQGIPRLTALETIFGGRPPYLALAYL